MDLRALRYFESVAELRSFSKAAVRLRVAQPALSRQVQKLEHELGVRLLRRNGRGIELTESGLLLLQRARLLSQDVSALIQDVRSLGDGLHGTLTIGVPPTIGDLLIPPLYRDLAGNYPNLRLVVVESASPDLYERLLTKELSLAIMHNPKPHPELVIAPVLRDYLYVIGPGKETCGLAPVVPDQAIEGLPMILPRPPHNRRLLIDKFCIAHGIELSVRFNVDGFSIIKAMVEDGLGYSILSYYGVHEAIVSGRLSGVRIAHPPMPWELCIAFRRDTRAAKPVKVAIGLIREEVQAIINPGTLWPHATYVPAADR